MRVKWAVELDGEVHMIELDHGDYSGRKTIKQVRVHRLLYGGCVQGSGRHPGRS
jgi:hypothetical protein